MQYSHFVGIDVSMKTLTVVISDADKHQQPAREFPNTPKGHRQP